MSKSYTRNHLIAFGNSQKLLNITVETRHFFLTSVDKKSTEIDFNLNFS
jgi:hypothetical protein